MDDSGKRRAGDIIHSMGVVEIKRKKSTSFKEAKSLLQLVKPDRKPWLLVEFRTGEADLVKLTMNHKTAAAVCNFIDLYWGKPVGGETQRT